MRSQYPADINVTCDFDMDALRASMEDRAKILATLCGRKESWMTSKLKVQPKGKNKAKAAKELPPTKRTEQVGKRGCQGGGGGGGGGKRMSSDRGTIFMVVVVAEG